MAVRMMGGACTEVAAVADTPVVVVVVAVDPEMSLVRWEAHLGTDVVASGVVAAAYEEDDDWVATSAVAVDDDGLAATSVVVAVVAAATVAAAGPSAVAAVVAVATADAATADAEATYVADSAAEAVAEVVPTANLGDDPEIWMREAQSVTDGAEEDSVDRTRGYSPLASSPTDAAVALVADAVQPVNHLIHSLCPHSRLSGDEAPQSPPLPVSTLYHHQL